MTECLTDLSIEEIKRRKHEIVEYLNHHNSNTWPYFRTQLWKMGETRENLRCIYFLPPIVGSSTIFRPLVQKINLKFNAYGFQLKGFDTSEQKHNESIEEIAREFVDEIKFVHKDVDVCLDGFSMAVIVAFEIAKILESENFVTHLVLIDRPVNPSETHQSTKYLLEKVLARKRGILSQYINSTLSQLSS